MYRIHLDDFEGPLDLLLFFIRRSEFDVQDIPIAQITDEYLAYVRLIEEVDLDGAADFIYMAAVLIGIKAKMLLPRPEQDEDGEPIDPRRELVERLLEYMRYKEAAHHLAERFELREQRVTRDTPLAVPEAEVEDEQTYNVSVFDLISVLKKVLDEAPEEAVHRIRREAYSLEDQKGYLLDHLPIGQSGSFVELVSGRSRPFIIASFLAVLELVRSGQVRVVDNRVGTDFYLQRLPDFELSGDGAPPEALA